MTNPYSIPICFSTLLLLAGCDCLERAPKEELITTPVTPPKASDGLVAPSLEKPSTLRPCNGHDLPFLVGLQGATENKDIPFLHRFPVLVADPATNPVTLSRTRWANASNNDWTQALGRDLNAISLGLDWLPLKRDLDSSSGKVVSWSPENLPAGFASIFFVRQGAVWAYSWGENLVALYPDDADVFLRSETLLHSRASLTTLIGGDVVGLDFNGGFQGAWLSTLGCFSPPGALPSSTEATLFYSRPGVPLYTSHATAGGVPPGGSPVWTWSPGTPVELLLSTDAGVGPLLPAGSGIDLVAFSYDRFNSIVMYSTSDETSAPFMVADAIEGVDTTGVVVQLVLTNNAPLLDHSGGLLGGHIAVRPTGSCGIDPRRILGRNLPGGQRQAAMR